MALWFIDSQEQLGVCAILAVPHITVDVDKLLQAARTAMAFWGGNAAQRCFLRWRRYLAARRQKQQKLTEVRSTMRLRIASADEPDDHLFDRLRCRLHLSLSLHTSVHRGVCQSATA